MSAIPAPLFALVGATDVVTTKARALPLMLAEIEIRRFERPSVDVTSLDPRKVDLRGIDLRKVELRRPSVPQVEVPKVEFAEVAGAALQFAARAERTYEDMVTRGELIVARVRGTQPEQTPVATPPAAPVAKKAAKKTAKSATAKKTTKPAAKADEDTSSK